MAQVLTPEDSLSAGLIQRDAATIVSGYGEVKVMADLRNGTATANLSRAVIFLGHRFNKNISFLSEMELEDAKVAFGGEDGSSGEIAFEQLMLKFDLTRDLYLTGGLMLPRLGIINENHLPNTYNGNDRPLVETLVLPSTWREIGVMLWGRSQKLGGLNWNLGVMNGLDASGFENGTGIREGRGEGSNASAANLAVTGALLHYAGKFRLQTSAYYGGAAGLSPREADSLQLESGVFGTPIGIWEADAQYISPLITARVLGTMVSIPQAQSINRAYANNTPEAMVGAYAEAAIDLVHAFHGSPSRDLWLFARYELANLQYQLPENGITNPVNEITQLTAGISYLPVRGVTVKADMVVRTTGDQNPQLVVTPYPQALPFFNTNTFVNVGVGYSF
jgi:hypothetical protein